MRKTQMTNINKTNSLIFPNDVAFSNPIINHDAVNVRFDQFSLYEDWQYLSYVTCNLDDIEI